MAGLRTPALAVLLCLYWHHVLAGTLFAVPGDDVFFNISITSVRPTDGIIALERSPDDKHKVMVFLDRRNPPNISGAYRRRISFTGNIGQAKMNFWLYNVSIKDAGEFRVVSVGLRKVFGSQILAVAGRPDNPTIAERTFPQINKDHVLECKTQSNSRPKTNGFKMRFIWKRNDTVLLNNSVRTVQGKILIIRHLQREDRFDKYTCTAYDSDKLLSNGSNYYQIDPKYGPSEDLTLDPSNRTYFVEEGFELANITCSADCHPHCIFSWDRGLSHGAKLYLGVIDKAKSGIYRCTAQNPVTNVNLTTALELILTSLSSYKYGLLRRKKIYFQFVCDLYNSKPEADGYYVEMNLSDMPNTSSIFEMDTGTARGQMESTRNSMSISINKDDISTRLDRSQQLKDIFANGQYHVVNELMINNDAASTSATDISSFDVQRPHRSLTPEEEEA